MPRVPLLAMLCGSLACTAGNSRSGAANAKPSEATAATASASSATAAPVTPAASAGAADSLTDAADRGRVLGAETATVWLLVVSDFQCPYCRMWHDSAFRSLRREYVDAGKIRMAYMNFPLDQHKNAWPSAMAAMCASAQGKFWPTQDRIFEAQKKWEGLADPAAYLDSLAVASGADPATQRDCTRGRKLMSLIERDQLRMRQAGVLSTPTFFVGARKIEGAQPADSFRKVIDSLLTAGNRKK